MTRLYLDAEAVPPGTPPEDPEELEEWAKLALRPGSARIVCMSFAKDEGDPWTVQAMPDIAAVLWEHRRAKWVAHGGRRYDFPLLYANLVRAGSRQGAVSELAHRLFAKPWESPLIDTAPCGRSYFKLSEYCEMHGVPGKTDDIGADIWRVWPEDPERVISYCEGDVVALRAAHQEYLRLLG